MLAAWRASFRGCYQSVHRHPADMPHNPRMAHASIEFGHTAAIPRPDLRAGLLSFR
jgi:hypothetical protein